MIARHYDSSLAWRHASLGHGWHLSLDQRIWQEAGRLVVRRSDGREVELDTLGFADGELPLGQSLRDPVDGFVVHRTSEHAFELHEDGMVEHYAVLVVGGHARIQRRRDAHSLHATDYGYDDVHELAWVRDSAGRMVHVERDSHARITAIKVPIPDGRGWVMRRRYRYDEAGDLVRVDDTRGASWTYAYVAHLKVRKTDRTGLSWLYEYDGCGRGSITIASATTTRARACTSVRIRFDWRVGWRCMGMLANRCSAEIFGLDWNYVLVDDRGRVYYAGRADDDQTPNDVMRRHGANRGRDGFRYRPGRDHLVPITPTGTGESTARGIEDLAIDHGTREGVIGRALDRPRSEGGLPRRRGNNIRGVRENHKNRGLFHRLAGRFLDDLNMRTINELIEHALRERKAGKACR